MQGPVDNALMLTVAGNAFLAGRDITGFWPDAPTFRFMKLCEFRTPPASGRDTDEFPLRAADPMAWFASLKPWCRGLRLHNGVRPRGPNQQIDAPDRMLAAFVGGGARWLIEAVGSSSSEIWEGFHRLGDRNDPERKIWFCTHVLQFVISAPDSDEIEANPLQPAVVRMRASLVEIEAFARAEQYENFADCFARALVALDDGLTGENSWAEEVALHSAMSRDQLAVYAAINHASVFGGMGSWNDLPGGARYDEVSEALYTALNDCTAALASSTFRA